MSESEAAPPGWAEGLLRAILRPGDRDAITGDLLEEYREVRRPALGRVRSLAWYLAQVLSVAWPLVWPFAAAGILLKAAAWFLPLPNASLFQAPGVSAHDAALCLAASYYASQRTRLIRTGMVVAGVTNVAGVALLFALAAVRTPSLVVFLVRQPAFVFFPATFSAVAFAFGAALGCIGGSLGRWLPPDRLRPRLT
jgi:hypothetical protein